MGWDGSSFTQIDQMVYTYQSNSNVLQEVADAVNDSRGFKETNQSGNDYAYTFDRKSETGGSRYFILMVQHRITKEFANTMMSKYKETRPDIYQELIKKP